MATRLAVAAYGPRVAPRWDGAAILVVADLEGERIGRRWELDLTSLAVPDRVARLQELGVHTLVAGAIDRWTAAEVEWRGIRLLSFVTGDVEDVLYGAARGTLVARSRMGAGGRCRGRWRRGRGRGRGRW